jgi:NAD(P)-dependent dehydrogenase (short-subunit alcohol dehydrogenase family)
MNASRCSLEGGAMVTGDNGGLGRAMTRALLDAEAIVVISRRDAADKNLAAVTELADAPASIRTDVRDEHSAAAIAQVAHNFGHLDLLINNADHAHAILPRPAH